MNAPIYSRVLWKKLMKSFSLCLHIYINETQQKGRFRHLRITLLQGFPVLTDIFPCIFGADWFYRHATCWIYFNNQESTLNFLLTHKCMEHMISMLPLFRLQEFVCLYMKNQQSVEAGQFGELMAGIWVTLFTTKYVLEFLQITQPTSA